MNEQRYITPGIPDECFTRLEGIPMTKQEIRILSIAKLRLFPTAVVYDLGAGSGSVAIECQRLLPLGKVFAVEKNLRAIELINKNCADLGIDLAVIAGTVPEALQKLPPADRIFLGGSGGRMPAILGACDEKLKSGGWLVINTVSMDSGPAAYSLLKDKGYHLEAVQVNIAVLCSKGNTQLWQARNPVTILAAQKRG